MKHSKLAALAAGSCIVAVGSFTQAYRVDEHAFALQNQARAHSQDYLATFEGSHLEAQLLVLNQRRATAELSTRWSGVGTAFLMMAAASMVALYFRRVLGELKVEVER